MRTNTSHFSNVCMLIFLAITLSLPQNVWAQSPNIGSIYVVTQNDTTLASTVWNLNLTSNKAEALLTPDTINKILPQPTLSDRESLAKKTYSDMGSFPSDLPNVISQSVQGLWRLDKVHFVVETSNEQCNRRGANLCVG